MEQPPIAPPDREGMVADLWQQLLEAAQSGDEQALLFLRTFEPWAREALEKRLKS